MIVPAERACVICGSPVPPGSPRRLTCRRECLLTHRRKTTARYRERVRNGQRRKIAAQRCFGCRENLPREAFGESRCRYSGLQGYCKTCRAEYDQRPDQVEINRRRKRAWFLAHEEACRIRRHVHYILHHEEANRRRRERYLFDLEFRRRHNEMSHARYHANRAAIYQRSRELKRLREEWEARDERRCFCGKALPGGDGEDGRWFCRPACKVACSRFVCGLEARRA